MDKKQETIATYNQSALAMAHKFDGLGARVEDIEKAFAVVAKENPFVLEIGCCSGREAMEITKRTNRYLGIDVAEEFIKLARKKVPEVHFEVADIDTYIPPKGLDIIFAFASLIHTPKHTLKTVFQRLFEAMNKGGIFVLSMKYALEYTQKTKIDEFGTRTYYFYSNEEIAALASQFQIVENKCQELRGQVWIEMVLRKDS